MTIQAFRPSFNSAATPYFGQGAKKHANALGEKVEKSWWGRQLYFSEKPTSPVPWYLRWKGYGSKANLKAGWENAMAWFKPKDTAGKILAIATLAVGIATDFGANMLIVGIPYVASKLLFSNMNISGFATAFHDGVHTAYEKQYVAQHPEKSARTRNRSSNDDSNDWVDDSLDSHNLHHLDDHHTDDHLGSLDD